MWEGPARLTEPGDILGNPGMALMIWGFLVWGFLFSGLGLRHQDITSWLDFDVDDASHGNMLALMVPSGH